MSVDFLLNNSLIAVTVVILCYIALRLIYKRSIITLYDPLHINVVILSCYLSIFALPIYIQVSMTYWVVVLCLILFLIASSVPGGNKKYCSHQYLSMSDGNQLCISIIVLIITFSNFFVNLLLVPIPLFSDDPALARGMYGSNSRLLFWAASSTSLYPIQIFSLTNIKRVRYINVVSLIILLTSTILAASKGALLNIVLMYFNYRFLLHLQGKHFHKKHKKIINIILLTVIISFPFAMKTSGYNNTLLDSLKVFIVRLLGGFDQLIYYIIACQEPINHNLSITQLYFLPFLKIFFSYQPEYNSVIDFFYINYLGITSTANKMLPNSNLIMEAIFTNGVVGGLFIVVAVGYTSFYIRKRLLERHGLRLFDLMLSQFFVMAPFFWLMDGQRFFISLYTAFITYVFYALTWLIITAIFFRKSIMIKLV